MIAKLYQKLILFFIFLLYFHFFEFSISDIPVTNIFSTSTKSQFSYGFFVSTANYIDTNYSVKNLNNNSLTSSSSSKDQRFILHKYLILSFFLMEPLYLFNELYLNDRLGVMVS